MDDVVSAAVPILAVFAFIGLATFLLTRARAHARPPAETPEEKVLQTASRRQQRILEKLEPLPEIPTVMDLMRQELEETGVEQIPGSEGLSGPVMLKVFKRDAAIRERCDHDAYEFVMEDDVNPEEATEDQVVLFCSRCGAMPEATGTDSEPEAL